LGHILRSCLGNLEEAQGISDKQEKIFVSRKMRSSITLKSELSKNRRVETAKKLVAGVLLGGEAVHQWGTRGPFLTSLRGKIEAGY